MAYTADLTTAMTSNDLPDPNHVTASHETAAAYFAFDHVEDTNHKWLANSATNTWITFNFGSALYAIAQYTLLCPNEADVENRMAHTWLFRGSPDNSTWTTLDSQDNQHFTIHERKTYQFSNTTAYQYYIFQISANGGASGWTAIEEIQMMADTNKNVAVTITGTADIAATAKKGASTPVKWSGIGMNLFPSEDAYIETVLANGFTQVRHMVRTGQDIADSKAKVLSWIAKGAQVIWGVGAETPLTAANYSTYSDAVLSAAAWAEANGVYEFEIGNEEEQHVDGTTLTVATLRTNLKTLATAVQAIYTIGNVSYACALDQTALEAWDTLGKGDIDILSWNGYLGGSAESDWAWWLSKVNWMHSHWANSYLTEFSLNATSLATYSADEQVQAAGISRMIDLIQIAEVPRAFYFQYKGTNFGALKDDEVYRQLWSELTGFHITGTATTTGGVKKGGKVSATIADTIEIVVTFGTDVIGTITFTIANNILTVLGVGWIPATFTLTNNLITMTYGGKSCTFNPFDMNIITSITNNVITIDGDKLTFI